MEEGRPSLQLQQYVNSGHFIQATFENWESEFLQMMLYVVFTVFLRQKGSSESKGLEGEEDVDKEPKPHPAAPWPVKKEEFGLTYTSILYPLLLAYCSS
ncbi:hypothetical protein MKP09_13565 [Niabella ginsengisoli]|uniref:Uncharacterized protein n=1 Tax=Niabella ginsengisoli TaxID=522298 RepID=A0ABS9SKF9_9BACT|nr:hypothetical protein [Niabella ginsengisoli]